MLIYNASIREQSIKVYGNWFTFAPGKWKFVSDNIGHAIVLDRKDYGLVALPDKFAEDPSYAESEEGAAVLKEKEEEGRQNRITHLNRMKYNLDVSLRQDLSQKNIKADPYAFASKGEVDALKELAEYHRAKKDQSRKKAAEVADLVEKTYEE